MKCAEIRCRLCKHHEVCKYSEDVERIYEEIRNINIPVPNNIARFDISCKYFETVIYNTLNSTDGNHYINLCVEDYAHNLEPIQYSNTTGSITATSTDVMRKLDHDTDHDTHYENAEYNSENSKTIRNFMD